MPSGLALVACLALVPTCVGAVLIGVMLLAIGVGVERPFAAPVRSALCIALVTGSVVAFEPALWWLGPIVGLVLALCAEVFIAEALERPRLPESVFAAYVVAGITTVLPIVAYTFVRLPVCVPGLPRPRP